MEKKLIILAILILVLFSSGCKSREETIKNEIEKANYCETNAECVYAGSKCPFGCFVYVNENEAERISKLVTDFKSSCVSDCPEEVYNIVCENNKCVIEEQT